MHTYSRLGKPTDADAPCQTLFKGRWLSLHQCGRWEYVARNHGHGAVVIIAVTPEDRVLFVEQYRVPIGQFTIEMPAGLIGDRVDHQNEGMMPAARRELMEETGWHCDRLELLHQGPSSAGMSTENISFVRAFDLTRIGPGGGDETENIRVHAIPRHKAGIWLKQCAAEGYSIDPKLFAGLWLLEYSLSQKVMG